MILQKDTKDYACPRYATNKCKNFLILLGLTTIFIACAPSARAGSDLLPFDVQPYVRIDAWNAALLKDELIPAFIHTGVASGFHYGSAERFGNIDSFGFSIGGGLDFGPVRVDVSYYPKRTSRGVHNLPFYRISDDKLYYLLDNDIELSRHSALLNIYWDIYDIPVLDFVLTPYVGASIGKTWFDVNIVESFIYSSDPALYFEKSEFNKDDKTWTKGATVGASLKLHENIAIDVAAQMLFTQGFKIDSHESAPRYCCLDRSDNMNETRVSIGLRWML